MVAILGANSVSGEYEVSNSLRFNSADQPSLTKTFGSAGNRKTFTLSCWVKRGKLDSTEDHILSAGSSNDDSIFFNSSHYFRYIFNVGGSEYQLLSNQVFRDVSAWYHLVVITDTTQSTATDRIKVYVNGNQITSFQTDNRSNLSQNHDMEITNSVAHCIGDREQFRPNTGNCFDGYLSEMHFIDGTAKAHTDFGEFDDNGVWIPIKYTGSYGTNGFFLEFKQTGTSQNSSGIGADTSGNDNHFAVTNLAATDITEDTPTNNFCTWNPLDTHSGNTFTEGNLKVNGAGSARLCSTTFAPSQGKWYQEFKLTDVNSGSIYNVEQGVLALSSNLFVSGSDNTGIYFSGPSVYRNGSNQGSITGGFSDNDILQIALDLDNNNVYYGKNGSWSDGVGGGFDQSDFSNASGFALTRTTSDNNITFSTQNGASGSTFELIANWGNPPYAVSSSNNDGKYGNFEYAPPSGYYALCTKRLAEFG